MRFRVVVTHPKGGARKEVSISAPSANEARLMIEGAGLIFVSLEPDVSAPDDPDVAAAAPAPVRVRRPVRMPLRIEPEPPAEATLGTFLEKAPFLIAVAGAIGDVWALIWALVNRDWTKVFITVVGFFILAIFAAYRWARSD